MIYAQIIFANNPFDESQSDHKVVKKGGANLLGLIYKTRAVLDQAIVRRQFTAKNEVVTTRLRMKYSQNPPKKFKLNLFMPES